MPISSSSRLAADTRMGLLGASISIPAGFLTMKASQHFLSNWGAGATLSQSLFPLFEVLSKVSHGLLRGMLKTFAVVYVILLVPIAEEWLFRGRIFGWQQAEEPQKEPMSSRVYRVITNSIVFGAFHCSLMLGWASLPIFLISTVTGVVFATLRERSGGLVAPIVSHSMNNAVVLFMVYLNIL